MVLFDNNTFFFSINDSSYLMDCLSLAGILQ